MAWFCELLSELWIFLWVEWETIARLKAGKWSDLKKNINPAALLKTWSWATGEGVETTVIRSQQRRVDGWTNSEIVTEMVRRAQI